MNCDIESVTSETTSSVNFPASVILVCEEILALICCDECLHNTAESSELINNARLKSHVIVLMTWTD